MSPASGGSPVVAGRALPASEPLTLFSPASEQQGFPSLSKVPQGPLKRPTQTKIPEIPKDPDIISNIDA